jgi:predicted ferric reductase
VPPEDADHAETEPAADADQAAVDARRISRLVLERRLWIAGYVVLLLWPLVLVVVGRKAGSTSTGTVAADAAGFVAFTALALQIVMASRLRTFTAVFGVDLLLRIHRTVGKVIVALVALHIVVLMVDDHTRLALLDSFSAPLRAKAAMLSTLAVAVITFTSFYRGRLHVSYERWRAIHLGLGAAAVAFGFAHAALVAKYAAVPAVRWLLGGYVAAAAAAIFYLRVWGRFTDAARPYVVVGITHELGNATTVRLRADGHAGTPFQPGQFAWIKLADRPYALAEHPFSYSSSACVPAEPSFTIKQAGDFTTDAAGLAVGTRVLVDGPHGSVAPKLPGAGFVLVAGGVGITPSISIIRTLADLADPRPVQLIYACRDLESATFREQLGELQRRGAPELDVVYVLSRPADGWRGERGRLDAMTLGRVIARDARSRNVFVCGPPAMAEAAEDALLALGVPRHHLHVEHFASV